MTINPDLLKYFRLLQLKEEDEAEFFQPSGTPFPRSNFVRTAPNDVFPSFPALSFNFSHFLSTENKIGL
jgi:hypothetical protein